VRRDRCSNSFTNWRARAQSLAYCPSQDIVPAVMI